MQIKITTLTTIGRLMYSYIQVCNFSNTIKINNLFNTVLSFNLRLPLSLKTIYNKKTKSLNRTQKYYFSTISKQELPDITKQQFIYHGYHIMLAPYGINELVLQHIYGSVLNRPTGDLSNADFMQLINGLVWSYDNLEVRDKTIIEINKVSTQTIPNWKPFEFLPPDECNSIVIMLGPNIGLTTVVSVVNTNVLGNFAGCFVPREIIAGLLLSSVVTLDVTSVAGTSLIGYIYETFAYQGSVLETLLQGEGTHLSPNFFKFYKQPSITRVIEINFPQNFIVHFGGVAEGKLYTLPQNPFTFLWGKSLSYGDIQNFFLNYITKPKYTWILQQPPLLEPFKTNLLLTDMYQTHVSTLNAHEQINLTKYHEMQRLLDEANQIAKAKLEAQQFRDTITKYVIIGTVVVVVGVSYYIWGSPPPLPSSK